LIDADETQPVDEAGGVEVTAEGRRRADGVHAAGVYDGGLLSCTRLL
jgi:hypothetical protein